MLSHGVCACLLGRLEHLLILSVDDETDLKEMEANVRAIEKDGLVWGASKFVAVGFGIKKLQINLVVEDEKVSTDELQQQIEEDEDHVQSTDIVSETCALLTSAFTNDTLGCHAEAVKTCLFLSLFSRLFGAYTTTGPTWSRFFTTLGTGYGCDDVSRAAEII